MLIDHDDLGYIKSLFFRFRCLDLDNRFECECREGFVGEFCDNNVNDCASDPCMNGGSCSDQVGGYVCSCPSGWGGDRCEQDIGYCDSDPCENNAECINLFQVSFTYHCTFPCKAKYYKFASFYRTTSASVPRALTASGARRLQNAASALPV